MNADIFNTHLAMAPTAGAGLTVETPKLVLYPYRDVVRQDVSPAAAYFARVTDADGVHAVLVSHSVKDDEVELNVWCGDKFIEGRSLDPTQARKRVEEAAQGRPRKDALIQDMLAHYNTFGATPGSCDFWKVFRRDKKLCKHAYAMLAHLQASVPDFQLQLQQAYDKAAGAASAGSAGDTYALDELAFKVPVLFEGDRGSGKTVTAREFARKNAYHRVEFGGHEGTESPDLLGYLVPHGPGAMVWKDGPLSEAWRSARTRKTVLIIDELLRIPVREQSILLTALSPDEGVYRLRTGRVLEVVDGVAQEEVLECPVDNLCVIATTNVGSEYAVDEIDAAVEERFISVRKDTNLPELTRILTAIAKAKGLSAAVATQCTTFFSKMVEARSRGLVRQTPTTRTLARALELASSDSDVKRAIKTQVLLWVARTAEGKPVEEQVADVEKIIERCFK